MSESWSNWQLEKELDSRGISTIATVTRCNPGQKITPVTFKFVASNGSGSEKSYEVTNSGGGGTVAKCKKGKAISIRYLPESPQSARHGSSSDISVNIVIAVCSLLILAGLLRAMIKQGLFAK